MAGVEDRTPVLVGVGQAIDRMGSENYAKLSAVELAAAAAREALADSAVDAKLLADRIDTIGGVRQFETSGARMTARLGRSDNFPRAVAKRIGAAPRHAILEAGGGQSPQVLLASIAQRIADGESEVALVVGGEALSTARALAGTSDAPDFSERVGGQLEDRGFGEKQVTREFAVHGLSSTPAYYALFENARRARAGLNRDQYRSGIGELFAPFSQVAADNPYAVSREVRSPHDLACISDANRLIAEPYLRFHVSRDLVNQGAAILVCSITQARELGVPSSKWIFIHGYSYAEEKPILDRPDLSSSPAARAASHSALTVAGIDQSQVAHWDFYSCFPIAVYNAAMDGLGLHPDDPRGLTVTGGLPFFGGAGNNYSMHAIAEMVARLREKPGTYGFVGANGGLLSKYAAAVYSSTPAPWRNDHSVAVQLQLDDVPAVPQVTRARGWAVIETYTVQPLADGARSATVVGRLEGTRERFIAKAYDDDPIWDLLDSDQPIGARVWAESPPEGNRVRLAPITGAITCRPRLRNDYAGVEVSREDNLLVVTLNRLEARNALDPRTHQELTEVFDAYFADPTLWVAIVTGAGNKAFCAGNDLKRTAAGTLSLSPEKGFAGLTARRGMHKPVIAAVNGFAMGGGFETVLACHLAVAAENATFALSEIRVGLIAGAGGLVRLPRQIPDKVAHEMILTGASIDAQQALRWGLVNRVVPEGDALEEAKRLAREVLAGSPTSARLSLRLMEAGRQYAEPAEAVAARTHIFDELLNSGDAVEGVQAFVEKRRPEWRNY